MVAFTVESISDGVIGVLALLTMLTGQEPFNMLKKEETVELFVKVTSENPDEPLRGSELWDKMKEKFPLPGGGIDTDSIRKEMANQYFKSQGIF